MTTPVDPESLPAVFPLQTAARVLGVGRNQAYRMVHEGSFPVRVLNIGGRLRVSRYDLLRFLGADSGTTEVRPLRPVRGGGAA